MPNCAICAEFPMDDPRKDDHPAEFEVTSPDGTTYPVCRSLLVETILGILHYEGMVEGDKFQVKRV